MEDRQSISFLLVLSVVAICWSPAAGDDARKPDLIVVVHDKALLEKVEMFAAEGAKAVDGVRLKPLLGFLTAATPEVLHREAKGIEELAGRAELILDVSLTHKKAVFIGHGPVLTERVIQAKNFRYVARDIDPRIARHYQIQTNVAVTIYNGTTNDKIVGQQGTVSTKTHSFVDEPTLDDLRSHVDDKLLQQACNALRLAAVESLTKNVQYRIADDTIVAQVEFNNRFPCHVAGKLLFTAQQQTFGEKTLSLKPNELRAIDVVVARNVPRASRTKVLRSAKTMLTPQVVDLQLSSVQPEE